MPDPFKSLLNTSVKSTGKAAKGGGKFILDQSLEVLKTGKSQVSGQEKPVNVPQQNSQSGPQEKGYSTVDLAKNNAQSRRLIQALEQELEDIRKRRDQELEEQRRKEQEEKMAELRAQRESSPPMATGKKKRGIRSGPKARAEKKQKGIETRLSKD